MRRTVCVEIGAGDARSGKLLDPQQPFATEGSQRKQSPIDTVGLRSRHGLPNEAIRANSELVCSWEAPKTKKKRESCR